MQDSCKLTVKSVSEKNQEAKANTLFEDNYAKRLVLDSIQRG